MCWSEETSATAAAALTLLAAFIASCAFDLWTMGEANTARLTHRSRPHLKLLGMASAYLLTDATEVVCIALTQVADVFLWHATDVHVDAATAEYASFAGTRVILPLALCAQPLLGAVLMHQFSSKRVGRPQRPLERWTVRFCAAVTAASCIAILFVQDGRSLPSTQGWMAWGWGGDMAQPLPHVAHSAPVEASISLRAFALLWCFCAAIAVPRMLVVRRIEETFCGPNAGECFDETRRSPSARSLIGWLRGSALTFALGVVATLALAMWLTHTPASTWCGSGIVTASGLAIASRGVLAAGRHMEWMLRLR